MPNATVRNPSAASRGSANLVFGQALLAHQALDDLADALVPHRHDDDVGVVEDFWDLTRRGEDTRNGAGGIGQLGLAPMQSGHRDAGTGQPRGQGGADDTGPHDEDDRRGFGGVVTLVLDAGLLALRGRLAGGGFHQFYETFRVGGGDPYSPREAM
jgi:hypothetical protein